MNNKQFLKQLLQNYKLYNKQHFSKSINYQQKISQIKQLKLQNQQIYNFGRSSNINVKVQGFKSKLIQQKQQKQETKENQETPEKQQKVDYREIELSNEQDEYQEHKTLEEQKDEEDQPFTKEQMKFVRDSLLYKGDDPYPEKLVHRPEKGVVWGLGGQLIKKKMNFFTQGQWPTHEEIMGYLELEQGKDIICIDSEEELQRTDISKYIIMASTYSCVHNFKIAKNLIQSLRGLQIPNQNRRLQISGQRDDEWLMVDFNNISVHLFVEDAREEIDLEFRLRNPVPDEEIDQYMKIAVSKKKQSVFEPLEEKY